ncbi:GNAT family N-acetyltransferase [soil metagenome]
MTKSKEIIMIETKRLRLIPLTYNQLLKYIKTDNSLEQELETMEFTRTISPDLKEAMEQTILPAVADTNNNYLYSTLWAAISKEGNKMIGDLCFKGEPNEIGDIEIGYGTYDAFTNNGYMTEAVGGMLKWAAAQPEVKQVIAVTEKSNIPSYRILEKNNFIKIFESETMFIWGYKIKQTL